MLTKTPSLLSLEIMATESLGLGYMVSLQVLEHKGCTAQMQ